jgi:N6-adenosine-specific RNA methylase IME4
MIINQLGRRNVIDFVRGEMAIELKKLLREVAEEASKSHLKQFQVTDNESSTDWQNFASRRKKTQAEYDKDRVNAQIGAASGLSYKKIYKIEKIKEMATPEELEELRRGKTSINKKYTEIMRGKRQEGLKATEFPSGKYRVIYADPPWDYGSSPTAKNTATPDLKYPVMSLEDICAIPVKDIADDNAVLFLWTTSYHIFQSQAVLDAWGFTYKSRFIWDKVKHNMGYYNSVRHEILLIATKGTCTPDNLELIDSVQSIERKRHSEKPEEFRRIIETLYKYGNKVELFARKQTEGWSVYGNEVGLYA